MAHVLQAMMPQVQVLVNMCVTGLQDPSGKVRGMTVVAVAGIKYG